jgi:transcription initiation factor TFIID subunit TAF12
MYVVTGMGRLAAVPSGSPVMVAASLATCKQPQHQQQQQQQQQQQREGSRGSEQGALQSHEIEADSCVDGANAAQQPVNGGLVAGPLAAVPSGSPVMVDALLATCKQPQRQ